MPGRRLATSEEVERSRALFSLVFLSFPLADDLSHLTFSSSRYRSPFLALSRVINLHPIQTLTARELPALCFLSLSRSHPSTINLWIMTTDAQSHRGFRAFSVLRLSKLRGSETMLTRRLHRLRSDAAQSACITYRHLSLIVVILSALAEV